MAPHKKRKRRLWIGLLLVLVLGSGSFYFLFSNTSNENESSDPYVIAELGTVVEKALATGTIEPDNEIEIKSKISGVVSQIFAEPGDYVQKGDPLIEVSPDPTPLELAEAKRNLERTQYEEQNISRELERNRTLKERNLISDREFEELQQQYNDVKIRLQINRERLELLESGRILIGDTMIESVIRAPIDGFILEKMVDVGEPVVPLTSYQAGTPLMSIAAMDALLFKGTVDEIDVGKIEEGMPVEIKIGALPGAIVYGEVSRISLKAVKNDNATVFPIEITITDASDVVLRAGYSANADIIIEQMENVVTIPERVVKTDSGRSFIEVPGIEPGSRVEKEVELGLSDAITVTVLEGIEEGDKVFERPERSLTIR
jgi:HlyD family secretion protein